MNSIFSRLPLPPYHSCNTEDTSFLFLPCLKLLLQHQMWPDQGSPDNVSEPVCHSWHCYVQLQSLSVPASRPASVSVFLPSGYVPLLPQVLSAHSHHPTLPHLKELHSFLFVVYPPRPWLLGGATSAKNCFSTWTVSGSDHAAVFSVWCAHISTLCCWGNCMNNNQCMCSLMLWNEYLKIHALYLHTFWV